jgi:hypothetical protein
MRKIFLWMPFIVTAVMLGSCVQQTLEEPSAETIMAVAELPVSEDALEGTKSVVSENDNGFEMIWGTSEAIGVYGNRLTNVKFTSTNKYYQQASTTFSGGSLFSSPKYAYYPYSADNASNGQSAVRGDLPSTQFFSTVLKKMNTDYKIGVYSSKSWNAYKFNFYHILTFVKFTVNAEGTALEGDKLQSVTLEMLTADGQPRQMNGKFTFDLTKSSTEAISGWDAPAQDGNKISLVFNDAPELSAGATYRGYASAAPLSVPGDVMKIKVVTDKHIATFSRTSKATFGANKVINLPITLANFSDLVVEDIKPNVSDEPTDDPVGDLSDATPVLNSFKFTVEKNPGKILSRSFTHNSSFSVTVNNKITEAVCTVDQTNKKVSLYLPYLNNRKLVPTFEIPEGTALVWDEGVIENEVTEVDFTKVKQVTVINGNNESVTYDVELTNTGLPVVVVNQLSNTTSTESDSEYKRASTAWYNATGTKWQPKDADWSMEDGDNFMVYNADGTSALTDKSGAIVETPVLASTRLRGNVTQQMPKKAFAVKLDKKHGVLDMPSHKRWVLLANWKDRTLMRNEVAFGLADVFKQTFPNDGMEWNPSGQHVELVYNGVYVGNYYLCEQVKIDGNRLDIEDPYDAEDAYSGNPADYGYLLEADDGYDETWKFTTACYVPFLFKDDGNDAMLSYASSFVRGIEDNLYKNTTAGYEAAFAQMDLTSFVDFWLVQEIMMNSETKHPKSCYNYINKGIMYAGPLWDFDWNTLPTSSSYSEEGYSYTTSMLSKNKAYHKRSGYPTSPNTSDKNYIWYPMLVKSSTFKALAAQRWNAVKGALEAYVNNEIPKVQAAIAKSEAENWKMWPVDSGSGSWGTKRYSTYGIGGGFCGDEGKSFSDAVSTMQKTLRTRISGMSYVSNKSWPSVTYSSK